MAKIREMIDTSNESLIKEQLKFLVSTAQSKLDVQKEILEKAFLNPASEEKIRVVPDTEVRWYDEYRCNVKEGADDSIDKVIDQFFSGSGSVKVGFKTLVKTALSTILGQESAGEYQKNLYVVYMEHNAIIRVDISVWRYNYTSDAVIGKVKDVFCCTFCKSVVDHTKVRLDTLIYLISELLNDDIELLKQYIGELREIWALLANEEPKQVLKSYKNKHRLWLNSKIDFSSL